MENVNKQLLALVKSLGHKTGCAKNAFGEQCTCGVDETIAAAEQAQQPCQYCDGTGDVHTPTGEWRGICDCEAGKELATKPPAQHQAEPVSYDRALIIEMLNRYCECVDARTHESGAVISQMDLLAAATQPPAVAEPSNQQRTNWQLLVSMYENGTPAQQKGAAGMAIAALRAMLAAAPQGAGDFKTWDAGAHEWWKEHAAQKGGA